MSTVDPSPTDLPAISYIRVAPVDPNDAARAVERQRAQIALAARHLGLRLVDEFADIGYSGMSMDRPGLRRLLDHVATHEVGCCIVATLDRLVRDVQMTADRAKRPALSVEANRLIDLRLAQHAAGLARPSDMRRDRGAVDAVHPGQLPDTLPGLVVGHQRLDLRPGQPPLDVAELLHVRTSRILKHRVRPHLTGLPDSLD